MTTLPKSLFNVYSLAQARQSILRRVPPDELAVTPGVLESIERLFGEALTPDQAVRRVITAIRQDGDSSLRHWMNQIDGVDLADFAVPPDKMATAAGAIPAETLAALHLAAERIEAFHRKQPFSSWFTPTPEGILGQMFTAIERIGVYVPGGTAPLPSSLLMSAIPAQVAGCREIIVCSPPSSDGEIAPVVLAAAYVTGIDKVYRLGGAQAIAAMAYGTESIPAVDKIVGPGNLFVTLAKRQVYGAVGIDGLLGPTETLVIADDTANAAFIAADLLAQAEHDVLASAILLTPSAPLMEQVGMEIGRQVESLARAEIALTALAHRGGGVLVASVDEAIEVANEYAVEHLCLSVRDPANYLGKVRNAGAVFLGEHTCEVLGDYVAGPSHSLPTGGTARFSSGLSVLDFVKISAVIALEPGSAAQLAAPAERLARAEGLTAHAAAAQARKAGGRNDF